MSTLGFSRGDARIVAVMNLISRSDGTVSPLGDSDANLVPISRAQALERLAHIDAILDMMDTYDEETLMVERDQLLNLFSCH